MNYSSFQHFKSKYILSNSDRKTPPRRNLFFDQPMDENKQVILQKLEVGFQNLSLINAQISANQGSQAKRESVCGRILNKLTIASMAEIWSVVFEYIVLEKSIYSLKQANIFFFRRIKISVHKTKGKHLLI